MINKSKPAITLAEIIVVIFIVGIIAGIFLAMPKKNVGQTDKAKYYVAYDMLKRLQDEQMADTGNVAIQNDDFCNAVNNWLNTININCAQTYAQLTNGMILGWTTNVQNNADGSLSRIVTVDIDGTDDGQPANTACARNDEDCHAFTINDRGEVQPMINGADWITFKVYNFNDDGETQIRVTNVDYNTANACRNGTTPCNTCDEIDANYSPCFMEAIQPLGK